MVAINKYLICFPFYVISQLITPLSLQKLCGMSFVTNMFSQSFVDVHFFKLIAKESVFSSEKDTPGLSIGSIGTFRSKYRLICIETLKPLSLHPLRMMELYSTELRPSSPASPLPDCASRGIRDPEQTGACQIHSEKSSEQVCAVDNLVQEEFTMTL
jgi:hypothetical protein